MTSSLCIIRKTKYSLFTVFKPLLASVIFLFLRLKRLCLSSDVIPSCPSQPVVLHWGHAKLASITESQNHRIVGVGRDICGSPSPTPLPKQSHLQQAAQDLVQVGLEYLQRRRLHNLPGQPVPVLRHPQREEVLPHVQLELPLLQFVPVAPCPVVGHH